MQKEFYERLTEIMDKESVLRDEPMSKHTTFRIGGPSDYFVLPKSIEEVKKVTALCKEREIPFYVLGNGSNLLVSDAGFRGVIIQIYKNMDRIKAEGCLLYTSR